jgi:hypothetical protein
MKLETVKKRVNKYYPLAKAYKELGSYYIGIPDSMDDTIINLFDEYFIFNSVNYYCQFYFC